MKNIKQIESKVIDWSDLKDLISTKGKSSCVVGYLNPFTSTLLYNQQVENCDYYALDGVITTKFFNFFNRKNYRTLSFDFSHVANEVFELIAAKGLSLGIVGAKEAELNRFVSILKNIHPELTINFQRNGYINSDAELEELILNITTIKPDVIILSLGTPLQEKFGVMLKSQESLRSTIIACGAFVSQTAASGGGKYYPPMIDKLSLRWLYRLYKEKHIRKRWLVYYPRFVICYPLLKLFSICKRFFL